ncbi:uncharacterized [Tachysurus ichikawai]
MLRFHKYEDVSWTMETLITEVTLSSIQKSVSRALCYCGVSKVLPHAQCYGEPIQVKISTRTKLTIYTFFIPRAYARQSHRSPVAFYLNRSRA